MIEDWLFDGATTSEEMAEFAQCAESALGAARSALERSDPDTLTEVDVAVLNSAAEAILKARKRTEALEAALAEAERLVSEILAAGQKPKVELLAQSG